jgi:signal transduction histidine kinase
MASKLKWQYSWIQNALLQIGSVIARSAKFWHVIVHPQPIAIEYRQWCDRLIRQRFWLAVSLAAAYMLIHGSAYYYEIFVNPIELLKNLALRQMLHLLDPLRQLFIASYIATAGLLGLVILFYNSPWGRRYPKLLIVLFPWAISFVPGMLLGAAYGIPHQPDIIMFMAQVAIAPIYWRLHLMAQIIPVIFYFLVYPLIGLGTFAGRSIYTFSFSVEVILVCIICEVGVYLYEQSKQAELEANRRLQLCIHTVTHDLRTPVMGSLMLLQSIQQSTLADQPIVMSQAEISQLIQGGDRLLGLMNTLLDSQVLAQRELVLYRQSAALQPIVATILQDFQLTFVKKNVQFDDRIPTDLPNLNIDVQQVWRVLCNLIGNAINHNSPGVQLRLQAEILRSGDSNRFHAALCIIWIS